MDNLISIIIPVFNVEKHINRCLNSVVKQTYINLEIILIDDGSSDNSGTICDEYASKDNRIIVIHKENGGVAEARNCGIDKARGRYIAFIDSDDFVTYDYIETLYNMCIKYKCDLAICGFARTFDDEILCLEKENEINILSTMEALYILTDGNESDERRCLFAVTWGNLCDKSLYEGVQFPKGKDFEDAAVMHKIIDNANQVVMSSKKMYMYYM